MIPHSSNCEGGWTDFFSKSICIVNSPKLKQGQRNFCQDLDGHLLEIKNAQELDKVSEIIYNLAQKNSTTFDSSAVAIGGKTLSEF